MRSVTTPVRQITPHPQSLSDPVARLFEADDCLLRGITPAHAPFYERLLLAAPALEQFCAAGLVRAEASDVPLDGYPLVVKHPRVDFFSVWREWPSLMLRDAALMVCALDAEMIAHDYGILDIHPWNVLFDFARPVFIDFSAVVPLDHAWLDELAGRFRDYWVLPLTFISMGHPHLARSIRKSCEVIDPLDEFFKRRELRWFPFWYFRLRRKAQRRPAAFFRQLRARLERLHLPGADAEPLSPPTEDCVESLRAFVQTDVRARTVATLLDRLRAETLFNVGCGAGHYALLAEHKGLKVIAIDEDETCVNTLYRHVKAHDLRILPLLLDFSIPTVGHWRKKEVPPATERLTCDVVLLLSLLERLVFDLELSFERIANLLAAYGRKYAIVEFMPPRGAHAFKHREARFAWYDMENFIGVMARHFRLAEVCELDRARKLLLFEKH